MIKVMKLSVATIVTIKMVIIYHLVILDNGNNIKKNRQ